MNKRGISAVVATVLIILITITSITIVWVSVIPLISESLEFSSLEGRVNIVTSKGYTVYDSVKEVAIVQIKRDVDEGVMDRIRISFLIDGNTVSSSVVAPSSGATKTYTFNLKGHGEPEAVSVAPIFVAPSGSEKEGGITSEVSIDKGNFEGVSAGILEVEREYFYEMPTEGLISHYRLNGDAKDSIGGSDGLLGGGDPGNEPVSASDCVVRECYLFDMNGDYIHIGTLRDDLLTTRGTIMVWAKPTGIGLNQYIFTSIGDNNNRFYLQHINGQFRGVRGDPSGVVYLTTPALNEWYHVALTWNSTHLNGYFDGEYIGKAGYTNPSLNSGTPVIGSAGPTDTFPGYIDEMMVYDRELSAEEVKAVYENQKV